MGAKKIKKWTTSILPFWQTFPGLYIFPAVSQIARNKRKRQWASGSSLMEEYGIEKTANTKLPRSALFENFAKEFKFEKEKAVFNTYGQSGFTSTLVKIQQTGNGQANEILERETCSITRKTQRVFKRSIMAGDGTEFSIYINNLIEK